MSFEPREYLRHILAEADYLIWDVATRKIPEIRAQIAKVLDAG